ncbi:hypothetical protein ASF49_18815 [Methylobacterium sp. Leaf104]|uniref:hypothetical protein n=1 Tax=Methylobacterium TaxID=407 RepID=UPI0006F9AA9B|nr:MULTISPECIES: hypothetical protein [Methylobacterium]KQP41086.1 hypothetical protein ASF49_18815 [Methylobacterium sp. Leaf104]MCI9882517.1 hypothetical protein [Methylobacterium goesingense]
MLLPSPPLDLPADALAREARTEFGRGAAEPPRPATLLPWALKVGLVVAVCAFGATQYLSRAVERGPDRQREARIPAADPETTGAIGPAASRTRLDPCTALDLRR